MKEIIFVTKQGTKLKRKDNQIVVFQGNEKLGAFPINRIEKIFLFGNIEISMPAINFLLSKGAEIYLLSIAGKFKGLITHTKLESNYTLRLKQYETSINQKKSLEVAKFFVLQKIQEIEKFSKIDLTDFKIHLRNSSEYSKILGIEGTVSSLFFSILKENLDNKTLGFEKREYRPARDPVNALLSFSYSLFYSLLFSILQSKGFDPYIGYLHRKRGSHAALASDFMEIFRVDISNFVTAIFNKKLLIREDFIENKGDCYLKENSLKKFLKIFKENYIDNKKYIQKVNRSIEDFIKLLNR